MAYRFVDGPVRVSVPATSANLGPGFDALGLALSIRDDLEAEVTGSGLEIEVVGAGAADVPKDESHLVVRSMGRLFDELHVEPPGLRLKCTNRIPHSRGLGSSSAAIVGGLHLARSLVGAGQLLVDDDALLELAADLEGHPDNVAPAVHGGFVISGREAQRWYAVPSAVDPRISAVVFIPDTPVSTELARGLLPTTVPHGDAAANAGRAALLVAALAGRPEHLLAATRDFLHQEQRAPAMPESLELVRALRRDGHPAIVSGAGPTVLAFTDAPLDPLPGWAHSGRDELLGRCPAGWTARHVHVHEAGARVER